MLAKQKAIGILENLRSRIPEIKRGSRDSREFLKWHQDVETAIREIFPGKKSHQSRFPSEDSFSRGVFRAGEGHRPAADAQWFSDALKRADSVLHSMVDEIQIYWGDNGTAEDPYGPQAASKVLAKPDAKSVFVVYGRNEVARKSMFDFLRAIGLTPKEWSQLIKETGEASPYPGHILDSAFSNAQAVVVLMTPDDEVRLRKEFRKKNDEDYERRLTHQARPNVLFELGMAMGRDARRTVIVELGKQRPFSDVFGRHVVRTNSPDWRRDLASRLETAECAVDTSGTDWLKVGKFS